MVVTIKHRLAQAMMDRHPDIQLSGPGRPENAYLDAERSSNKRGRGASHKPPFFTTVNAMLKGKLVRMKLYGITSFCNQTISGLAKHTPDSNHNFACNLLDCFGTVTNVGCRNQITKNASGLAEARTFAFKLVNTPLGDVRTAVVSTYIAFHENHAPRYVTKSIYRFNRRCELAATILRLAWPSAPRHLYRISCSSWLKLPRNLEVPEHGPDKAT
jgi:hypothetical protein